MQWPLDGSVHCCVSAFTPCLCLLLVVSCLATGLHLTTLVLGKGLSIVGPTCFVVSEHADALDGALSAPGCAKRRKQPWIPAVGLHQVHVLKVSRLILLWAIVWFGSQGVGYSIVRCGVQKKKPSKQQWDQAHALLQSQQRICIAQ